VSLPVLAHDLEMAIGKAAIKHQLEIGLVRGVVHVESSGDPHAWNPEPRYAYLWDVRHWRPFRRLNGHEAASCMPPADFPTLAGDRDQEWWGQRASWGLMQVMGAVAREHGFRGPYLTALCQVETGLHYGCLHLARLLRGAKGDVGLALARYNGGGTPNDAAWAYSGKVLALVRA
jgi:hypothetical protein